MTEQEAYETVREFFSRPGAKLSKGKGYYDEPTGEFHEDPEQGGVVCFYRHPDDPSVRCAVGCLIPDDLYDTTMEGRAAFAILDKYEDVGGLFPFTHDRGSTSTYGRGSILDAFQKIHDERADTPEQFVKLLDDFAAKRGLVVPV